MMSRLLPRPALTVLLALLWLLLNNTLNIAHLVLGLFLGWVIPLMVQRFLPVIPKVRHPFKLCLFALKVGYDIAVANISVARLVLGPKDRLRPAFVEVPMDIDNDFVLALLTSIISLTPGTVSASLRPDHKMLLVHGLDVPDVYVLISEIKQRYEAPLLEIFECSTT
jgi:multicomponent K+:H+ antiporter subunit E